MGLTTEVRADREWEIRERLSELLFSLIGPKPVADLARRLGDSTRTRAHKLLNPSRERGYGQSITVALVEELAVAVEMRFGELAVALVDNARWAPPR